MIIEAFYNNDVVYALGMTLIHSLWQIVLISLLLLFTLKALRNSPASTRYLFSVSAMVLVLGFAVLTFLYHFNHAPSLIKSAAGEYAKHNINIIFIPENSSGLSMPALNERIYEILSPYFPAISLAYFLVAFILAVKLASGLVVINKFRKQTLTGIPEKINESFLIWVEKMHIRPRPQLVESVLSKVPMVIGYFRPVIIVPAGTFMQIPFYQVEAIILHELAHIRRKDYLINILQSVIEIVFFYHPLVYWMSASVSEERENCCDDIALKYCKDRSHYVKALASVAEARTGRLIPSPSLAFVKKKRNLLERIKRILNPKNMKTKISDRILAGAILIAGTFIFLLTGSATLNDLKIDRGFSKPGNPEIKVNLNPALKERDSIININKGTIISRQEDKDGKLRRYRMTIKNGELKELYINGGKVAEKDFPQNKEMVVSTLGEIDKANQEMAKKNLEEVKIEIEKARQGLDSIDREKISKQVVIIKKNIENNNKEIARQVEKIKKEMADNKEEMARQIEKIKKDMDSIDYDKITAGIHKHLKDIDHEKIHIEIEKAKRQLNDEEIEKALEKVRKELDGINADSIRTIIKMSVKKFDEEEINNVLEKTRNKLESINIDSILNEVDKSMKQIKIIEVLNIVDDSKP